jgi:hypothetical protein
MKKGGGLFFRFGAGDGAATLKCGVCVFADK